MPLHVLVPIIQDNDSFKAKQKSPAIRARHSARSQDTAGLATSAPAPAAPGPAYRWRTRKRKIEKVHTNHKTLNAHGHTHRRNPATQTVFREPKINIAN